MRAGIDDKFMVRDIQVNLNGKVQFTGKTMKFDQSSSRIRTGRLFTYSAIIESSEELKGKFMFSFENEKNKEKKNIEIDIGECLLTVSDNRVA